MADVGGRGLSKAVGPVLLRLRQGGMGGGRQSNKTTTQGCGGFSPGSGGFGEGLLREILSGVRPGERECVSREKPEKRRSERGECGSVMWLQRGCGAGKDSR